MKLAELWVYLSASPLTWLTATLIAYALSDALAERSRRHPLANPVLLSVILIGAMLAIANVPYRSYFEGAQFVHFLLGPATVALGVPLWRHRRTIRANLWPMLAALAIGAPVAVISAVASAWLLGAPPEALLSLAPKSITAGVAMAVSETIGGVPALTAALVILTGVIGAVVVTPLMNAMGITDFAARGFAAGLSAHGIGTARAFQVDQTAGAFAGIALGLNALVTALLLPAFAGLLSAL
jgi:predicted murein hydrolase (TIGR00659 family)